MSPHEADITVKCSDYQFNQFFADVIANGGKVIYFN